MQDPTWELEHSCVRQLLRKGCTTPAALLVGKRLPPYLLASRQEGEQQAFERFLASREHLFKVRERKSSGSLQVTAVPGWMLLACSWHSAAQGCCGRTLPRFLRLGPVPRQSLDTAVELWRARRRTRVSAVQAPPAASPCWLPPQALLREVSAPHCRR